MASSTRAAVPGRWPQLAGFLLLVAGFAGCTFGNTGTLVARRTHTPTAELVEIYSLGLQARPSRFDGGLSLGWRKATYVYTNSSGETGQCLEWFHARPPAGRPLVRGCTVGGLELQATPEIRRVALGHLDEFILVGPAADESVTFDFHYVRTNPAATRLRFNPHTPPQP